MIHLTEEERIFIHNVAAKNNVVIRAGKSKEDEISISAIVKKDNSIYDGMRILYFDGVYEVAQYMAGKKENELHIYTNTQSLIKALESLIKGNKNRRIIERW
jgi:hypothetical protein